MAGTAFAITTPLTFTTTASAATSVVGSLFRPR